jgi:hypothetical protein
MKAYYDHEPMVLEAVGNGSWLFRWDIREEESDMGMEEERTRTQWVCDEVTVWSVDANSITQAVIEEVWDKSYEQKLVNEYNSAVLGLFGEEQRFAAIAKYEAFLGERMRLKGIVDGYFEKTELDK